MKHWYIFLLAAMVGIFTAEAKLTEDELEFLQDTVRIVAVNDDTVDIEDDFGEDVEWVQLAFSTNQRDEYKDDDGKIITYDFRVRVTVELTDKKTSTVAYSQFAREQGGVDKEYTGIDDWQFLVPQGELKRPKVTASVIEYGVMVDGEFIVLAQDFDHVDTLEELTTRTPQRLEKMEGREELKPKIEHLSYYLDSDGEEQNSGWE